MQFQHPHFFRNIAREVLTESLPDVWDARIQAGGVISRIEGAPEEFNGLACRRSTFEQVVLTIARQEPRLSLRMGHADRLVTAGRRVTGVIADGQQVDADLIISAAGRTRFADDVRTPALGGTCGFSYVARMYRAQEGAPLPQGSPSGSLHRGYLTMVFPQDDRAVREPRSSPDDVLGRSRPEWRHRPGMSSRKQVRLGRHTPAVRG